MKNLIIAIDGFSSGGKSTMAKQLARTLGYTYVDSGAMYRAVTLYALRNKLIPTDRYPSEIESKIAELQKQLPALQITFRPNAAGQQETYLNGENVEKEIRTLAVSDHVSAISTLDFVRRQLVHLQREMGKAKGIVMDGRDIGTVVFPHADLKIFLTATPEVRAQRRYDEMKQRGESVSYEAILENVRKRDHIDQTRTESPLRKAPDAIELNNDHLTLEEQLQWLLHQVNEKNQ